MRRWEREAGGSEKVGERWRGEVIRWEGEVRRWEREGGGHLIASYSRYDAILAGKNEVRHGILP